MSLRLQGCRSGRTVAVCQLPLSKAPETLGFERSDGNGLLFLYLPSRCFIPNIYAALSTAVLVPLVCLVTVLVVFIHAYQVTQQWTAYDDLYRGRSNSSGLTHTLTRAARFLCIYCLYV